ncbi:MAG TPA: hypothetical protein VL738_09335 [Dactylosporangium sp.]|nr:hypothetical protein [Dactylosporangium sp.]
MDADTTTAGLLALAAAAILVYHLDRLFGAQASQNSPSGRD